MLAESLPELLLSWPHWLFEALSDAVFGIILYPICQRIFRRWIIKHDQKEHNNER